MHVALRRQGASTTGVNSVGPARIGSPGWLTWALRRSGAWRSLMGGLVRLPGRGGGKTTRAVVDSRGRRSQHERGPTQDSVRRARLAFRHQPPRSVPLPAAWHNKKTVAVAIAPGIHDLIMEISRLRQDAKPGEKKGFPANLCSWGDRRGPGRDQFEGVQEGGRVVGRVVIISSRTPACLTGGQPRSTGGETIFGTGGLAVPRKPFFKSGYG